MSVQINNAFNIKTIELRKFKFEQIRGLENIKELVLEQGIGAKYLKKDSNTYLVLLEHKITIKQNDNPIYTVESIIMSEIEVKEEFDPMYLNGIAAILYSYLRPMVAQVTVMAKLPPLDLPPMNFTDLKVEEMKGLKELEDIKQ